MAFTCNIPGIINSSKPLLTHPHCDLLLELLLFIPPLPPVYLLLRRVQPRQTNASISVLLTETEVPAVITRCEVTHSSPL